MTILNSEPLNFPCTQCGLCCQKVGFALQTQALDRGDGTCKHYDNLTKLCTIYKNRPDICKIDVQYAINYANQYTWQEFVDLNWSVCVQLQNEKK